MKKSVIYSVTLITIILLSSCTRSVTPYEAANRGHGKRCLRIR